MVEVAIGHNQPLPSGAGARLSFPQRTMTFNFPQSKLIIGFNVVLIVAIVGVIVYAVKSSRQATITTPDGTSTVPVVQRKIETLELGDRLVDMDRLAESDLAYVLTESGQVAVVDTKQLSVEGQVQLLVPGTDSLLVNNLGLSHLTPEMYVSSRRGQVLKVSTNSFLVEEQIAVAGRPADVMIAPDGRYLFVINESPPRVNVVDLADLRVVKNLPVGRGPVDLLVDASGEFVYVANAEDGSISIISAINLSGVGSLLLGGRPVKIVDYPGRDLILILDQENSRVVAVSQRTNKIVGQISVVGDPMDMVLDSVRDRLYVIGAAQKGVGVVSLAEGVMEEVILLGSAFETGEGLKGIDLVQDSGRLVVLGERDVYGISF